MLARFVWFSGLAFTMLLTVGHAQESKTQPATFPAPVRSLELKDGDSIVFLGDSITHQCLYTQYVEDFFYTRYPNQRFKFHNAGVGGAKAWDALQRFDRDVAAYKPKYVTVLLGMNDGSYQPFNQQVFDTYQQDMKKVIEQIEATGATPILMTPTMFDARADRMNPNSRRGEATNELYNSVLAYYGTWLRDVAQQQGYGFVDMWGPLNNLTIAERADDPKFTMIADAIHPGPAGQMVMAFAILDDMGLRKPLSNITVDLSGSKPAGRGTGGKLTDLNADESTVSFTWAAESLPFVVPEEAREGAELVKLGHKASREAIQVIGLKAGRYELAIDGNSVGQYTAAQLAKGVELENNEKTPQYQQALKVAELNKQRNEGPVKGLRGIWSQFQGYARLKAQSNRSESDNAKLKQLEQQLENKDQGIAELEAAAAEIEDQIYEVNQPQPHTYELRAVNSTAENGSPRPRAQREITDGESVSGTVTLDGQPLARGTITFLPARGKGVPMEIDETGRFSAGIRTGSYRVGIEGRNETLGPAYGGKTSQLTVKVEEGANVFNFDLRR